MIFYFSGTGNSEWAAKWLAAHTADRACALAGLDATACDLSRETRLGIVFPIYAWDVPAPVSRFVRALHVPAGCYCYAVCTCGDECGNAVRKLQRYLPLQAALSLQMPNNYILGWDVDKPELEQEKLVRAEQRLTAFLPQLLAGQVQFDVERGSLSGLKSSVVSFAFRHFAMCDRPFWTEDSCTACGLCVRLCPAKNITLTGQRPVWHGNCTQCLACIHRCPQRAIQYGNRTKKRGRYYYGIPR